jgi:C_GCAxxG_C_C family probable redox protein
MMNEETFRMIEMSQQGFYCSQIQIKLGLENLGKDNIDLVRAMGGLAGGIGFTGKNCGALSGGACLLSLYAGKGAAEEKDDYEILTMISDLVQWFEDEFGTLYGGIDCKEILDGDEKNQVQRCPLIVSQTYEKVKEILEMNGYALTGEREEGL